jgi:hypothetical protein
MTTLGKIFIFINLFKTSIACYAQVPAFLVVQDPIDIIKSMNLEYKKPLGFDQVSSPECFKSYPNLERIITCAYNQLRSADQQFIVFTTLYRPLSEADSVFISKISDRGIRSLDWMHDGNIKGNIEASLGKDAAEHWREYVNYYSPDSARRAFNADSAISYSIKLDSQDHYLSRYNHLDVLCIAKKRRGVVYFYYFYTDEGKKQLSCYRKAMEGTFRYRD